MRKIHNSDNPCQALTSMEEMSHSIASVDVMKINKFREISKFMIKNPAILKNFLATYCQEIRYIFHLGLSMYHNAPK
jgi:hypothetical protein